MEATGICKRLGSSILVGGSRSSDMVRERSSKMYYNQGGRAEKQGRSLEKLKDCEPLITIGKLDAPL